MADLARKAVGSIITPSKSKKKKNVATCWCSSLLRLKANCSWLSSSSSRGGGAGWAGCGGVDRGGKLRSVFVLQSWK